MTKQDAILLLELTEPFTKTELKKAYRDAVMVWHPDRFEANSDLRVKAELRSYRINEAYELLSRLTSNSKAQQNSSSSDRACGTDKHSTRGPTSEPSATVPEPTPTAKRGQAWTTFGLIGLLALVGYSYVSTHKTKEVLKVVQPAAPYSSTPASQAQRDNGSAFEKTSTSSIRTDEQSIPSVKPRTEKISPKKTLDLVATLNHKGSIKYASFSPDSLSVVTASEDNTAQMWNTSTGTKIGKALNHTREVYTANFSPSGEKVITASGDGTSSVWDTNHSNQPLYVIIHMPVVKSACFSPDGNLVLTAGLDGTARLWKSQNGEPVGQPFKHANSVHSAAFSPNGLHALTTSSDKTARVWEITTAQASPPIIHQGRVDHAVFDPSGLRVASTGRGTRVIISRPFERGKEDVTIDLRSDANMLAFGHDGRYLAIAANDGSAVMWDTIKGGLTNPCFQHTGKVMAVAFSPDSRWLLISSSDGNAYIWDVLLEQTMPYTMEHSKQVEYSNFSPDGQWIITCSQDQTAKIWQVPPEMRSDSRKATKKYLQDNPPPDISIRLLLRNAEMGDADAQFRAGRYSAEGSITPKKLKDAYNWYLRSALSDHADAQYALAVVLARGEGVEKDLTRAMIWLNKSAQQSQPEAQLLLAKCYVTGTGVTKSISQAARWLQKAAVNGSSLAQLYLGLSYCNDSSIPTELTTALRSTLQANEDPLLEAHKWLSLALSGGHSEAHAKLKILRSKMTPVQFSKARDLKAEQNLNKAPTSIGSSTASLSTIDTKENERNSFLAENVFHRHLPSDSRLNTGSVLNDMLINENGRGKLTLVNGLDDDAFVKLLRRDRLVAAFYVKGGETFTFDHVSDGTYKVIFCTGYGWNHIKRTFERDRRAEKFDDALSYATEQTRGESGTYIRFSVMTLTLHAVENGNTEASSISLDEFDNYR
jgi:WD40 repeat protein/TPR repeat protein